MAEQAEKREGLLTLEELAVGAARGEEECFSRLTAHFAPFLSHLISPLAVPPEEKEDLKQEGLIGLYKAVLLFDPALSSFPTFARICMRSSVLDGLRKYRKANAGGVLSPETEAFPADLHTDPEEILMGKEALSSLLKKADSALSSMERRVLGLHLQGKKSREIALEMQMDRKSVENAMFRARKKLSSLV